MENEAVFSVENSEISAVFGQFDRNVKKIEKEFKVSKQYWRQAQVEMYAYNTRNLYIVAYALNEDDYNNYFNAIDIDRIKFNKVEYDEQFINNEYLPRLQILSECLKKGVFPNANYTE